MQIWNTLTVHVPVHHYIIIVVHVYVELYCFIVCTCKVRSCVKWFYNFCDFCYQDDVGGVRPLDPKTKEVMYNPKYEELYAPQVGQMSHKLLIFTSVKLLFIRGFIRNGESHFDLCNWPFARSGSKVKVTLWPFWTLLLWVALEFHKHILLIKNTCCILKSQAFKLGTSALYNLKMCHDLDQWWYLLF